VALFEISPSPPNGRPEAPDACDKGGTSPAKSKKELLIYVRDSVRRDPQIAGAIDAKTCSIHRRALRGPTHAPSAWPPW